jgi:hypothetical protein
MTDPPGFRQGDEVTAWRIIKMCCEWFGQPMPLWGLCLALGASAAFIAWRASHNGDQVPKRWETVTKIQSPLYTNLVNPPPANSDCGSVQCSEGQRHFDWNKPHVSVYSIEGAPHSLPTLRDLGNRAQAKAIDLLEQNAASEGRSLIELRDALDDSEGAASGEKDPFRFDRVLVATVAKGASWDPGDRMVWTRVFVQPINFSFAGYTVAATDNETVKVTSVEATNSRKLSADIGLTIPGLEGPKASLGPTREQSVKTSSEVDAQYEKLGVDITPNFLRVIRESETGGDVVGNTTISLTTVTDALTIQKKSTNEKLPTQPIGDDLVLLVTGTHLDRDTASPQDDTKQPVDADKKRTPSPIDVLPQIPVPHCALRATVWMLYEWREVNKGRESYDESHQEVTLRRDAEDKADVDIMSADEVSPAVWSLEKCENDRCKDGDENRNPLRATVRNGPLQWRKVVFTDYGVAVKLAHWLRTNENGPHSDLKYQFDYGSDSEHGAVDKVPLVPVKTTRDECRPQQNDQITRR